MRNKSILIDSNCHINWFRKYFYERGAITVKMCSRYDKIQHTELFLLYEIFGRRVRDWSYGKRNEKHIHVACSQLFGEWERENVRSNNSIQLHAPLYTHLYTYTHSSWSLKKNNKNPNVKRGEKKLEWMQKINNIEPNSGV